MNETILIVFFPFVWRILFLVFQIMVKIMKVFFGPEIFNSIGLPPYNLEFAVDLSVHVNYLNC